MVPQKRECRGSGLHKSSPLQVVLEDDSQGSWVGAEQRSHAGEGRQVIKVPLWALETAGNQCRSPRRGPAQGAGNLEYLFPSPLLSLLEAVSGAVNVQTPLTWLVPHSVLERKIVPQHQCVPQCWAERPQHLLQVPSSSADGQS